MNFPYGEIEDKLGYTFKNKRLLEEAFTHSSYANKKKVRSNERMEYLGDSVLQLIVTEWQYGKYPEKAEGKLTAERQNLVCRAALDTAVDALGIFDYLLAFGKGHYNVGDKAKSSLFEAVTAAIYLDGGYAKAKRFVLKNGNLRLEEVKSNAIVELKEYLEKSGVEQAVAEWEQTGKDHAPIFRCTLRAMGQSAEGAGKTKAEARSIAAARLLWELNGK